jgi:replicative DNA helicase
MAKSATTDIHRAPPQSEDAEQGVLGSMILDARSTIPEVVVHLNESYFYVPAHVLIYKALVEMWDKGKAVDLITVTQHLTDVGQIESVGGPAYVTKLCHEAGHVRPNSRQC